MANVELTSPFTPPLPITSGTKFIWSNLHGATIGLAIANAVSQHSGLILVITKNVQDANRLQQELKFFLNNTDIKILNFPDGETLPYDVFSPLPELTSQRLLTLHQLADLSCGILITPVTTLLQRLPPRSYLDAHTLNITCGDTLDSIKLLTRLEQAGYQRVSQVTSHGEFTTRGSLVDLFPMGSDKPFRLDLLDDRIENIKIFDPETQRSFRSISSIRFLPAREVPLNETGITQFRSKFSTEFTDNFQHSLIYKEVSIGNAPGGIEYYLPLFYSHTSTIFDFFPLVST
ncbi:hypothetical protein TI03_00730 [Achromatium sp. WMS1]|nr:hypothetical protein TI03_00730 [Achromatium sp. WMS1]